MKTTIKLLQHSALKIFIAPLSLIFFGLIYGIMLNQQIHWLSLIQIYLLVFISEIISHFFYIKYDAHNHQQSPMIILYVCEILLIALFIWVLMSQHWIVSILILLAFLSKHIIYYPYKFSLSPFHLILKVFFNTIVWNSLAVFTQAYGIENKFFLALIPIFIYYLLVTLQEFKLKCEFTDIQSFTLEVPMKYISILLALIAIIMAIYHSMPSKSYYFVQVLLLLITGAISIPIIIPPNNHHQIQNKINYLSSAHFLFVLIYTLSYLF